MCSESVLMSVPYQLLGSASQRFGLIKLDWANKKA